MAPRRPFRLWQGSARGASLAAGIWLGLAGLASACTVPPHSTTRMPESLSAPVDGPVTRAWYDGPTTRYAHGVLGDAIEGTELHAYTHSALSSCGTQSVKLPPELVFEDTTPRLADLNFDGVPEIMVVQSHQRLGAQLAVYGVDPDGETLSLIAATPFIGRSNRWLAPLGAADLDGDGAIEIAYIDRPHLARTLRIWRFVPGGLTGQGTLVEIASTGGLTNHRIGDPTIPGGIRDCGDGPEMITADAAWSRVIATQISEGGTFSARDLGPWSPGALNRALNC